MYIDPGGHVPTQGCGDHGKETCVESEQEKAAYEYFLQRNEHLNCKDGNMEYCSSIEKSIYSNRPITGIHIGYSGQAGFGLEGGAYVQEDWLLDWITGDIYETRTVGGFVSGGTPSAMSGQLFLGVSDVKGIPWYFKQEEVSNALAGQQIDFSGAVGVESIAVLDVSYGRSNDLNSKGKYVFTNGYQMYSQSFDFIIGVDSFPNLVDGGVQGGKSETFIVNIVSLR